MKLFKTATFQLEFDPEIETEEQFRAYTATDVAELGICVYEDLLTDAEMEDDDADLLQSDEDGDFDELFGEDDEDEGEV